MIRGTLWQLHDDESLRRIDAAAVRLLERSGCRIEHDVLLNEMEGAGCKITRREKRCYFPEPLVREAIEHLGGAPGEEVNIPVGWTPQNHLGHAGSFPHLLDWPSGRRRLARRQDVIDMAKMAHVLDEFGHIGKVLTCCEVDQRVEPLWAAVQLAEITDKDIGGGEVFYPENIDPLAQMSEVVSGKAHNTCLVVPCDFFIAPLKLDPLQAALFLAKRRLAVRNVPGTMPISGLSAPVTIAGTVAVAVAELMAGWVLGYVINPELEAHGIVATGSLDMRTGAVCFGSPEALLQDITTVQLCRRLYCMTVNPATSYVDCKRPGLEAVFQKMFPLVAAPFKGRLDVGQGLLSAGQDYSPVQHLLDAEINGAIDRFWGTFEVNEDTIALEVTQRIMRRDSTNFLETEHTLAHFREEQWYPRWFDRTLWQGEEVETQSERRMLERIDAYCKDAVARYEPPEIDKAKCAELRRIFRAAELRILGSNVTAL